MDEQNNREEELEYKEQILLSMLAESEKFDAELERKLNRAKETSNRQDDLLTALNFAFLMVAVATTPKKACGEYETQQLVLLGTTWFFAFASIIIAFVRGHIKLTIQELNLTQARSSSWARIISAVVRERMKFAADQVRDYFAHRFSEHLAQVLGDKKMSEQELEGFLTKVQAAVGDYIVTSQGSLVDAANKAYTKAEEAMKKAQRREKHDQPLYWIQVSCLLASLLLYLVFKLFMA